MRRLGKSFKATRVSLGKNICYKQINFYSQAAAPQHFNYSERGIYTTFS